MITNLEHLLIFAGIAVAAWCFFTYFYPRLLLSVYKRSLLNGFGEGPVPVNTLYMAPQAQFANPLNPQSNVRSRVATSGVNRDTLITMGWLDLREGPLFLNVPEMKDRYYSVQFTDPSKNTNFAYVGTRTTGSKAGDYLITGRGWKGEVPQGMTQISSPTNEVLLVGRVLVASDRDLPTAYGLAKQIQLSPVSKIKSGS